MLMMLIRGESSLLYICTNLFYMSKKKRDIKKLEKKIYSFLKSNPSKVYNYKQLSSCIGVKDTKTRNFIIRILSDLQRKGKIELRDRGRYFFDFLPKSDANIRLILIRQNNFITFFYSNSHL